MPGPSNNQHRGDDRGDDGRREREHNDNTGDSSKPSEVPDLGEQIAEGTYVMSVESGETTEVVSAGTVSLHEHGIRGREELDHTTLQMLGVKSEEAAQRALCGDNGQPNKSSVSVGFNRNYAAGWKNLWGQGNN